MLPFRLWVYIHCPSSYYIIQLFFCSCFQAELSCRFLGSENILPIKTRGHYVTLKFTADGWGTDSNKFTMVITAFKDPSKYSFLSVFSISPMSTSIKGAGGKKGIKNETH